MVKINVEKLAEIVREKGGSYGQLKINSKYFYHEADNDRDRYWAFNEMKYYLQRYSSLCDTEQTIIEMLGMDERQVRRLHTVARTILQWKFRTDWERPLPVPVLDRLERFIFGDQASPFDT